MNIKTKKEHRQNGFSCIHCHGWVPINEFMGTNNRNHCTTCLWSKHVDQERAGDRKSTCRAGMKPIGLTIKQAGIDKYGKPRQGELMIIHQCTNEGKISINRIAADDNTEMIMKVFEESLSMQTDLRNKLEKDNVSGLGEANRQQIRIQLFGKVSA